MGRAAGPRTTVAHSRRWLILMIWVLAACSGSAGTQVTTTSQPVKEVEVSVTEIPEVAAGRESQKTTVPVSAPTATLVPAPTSVPLPASPIDVFLLGDVSPGEYVEQWRQAEIELAELATFCMHKQGYEHEVLPAEPPAIESINGHRRLESERVREDGYTMMMIDQNLEVLGGPRNLVPEGSRITPEMAADGVFFQLRDNCKHDAWTRVEFFHTNSPTEGAIDLISSFRISINSAPEVIAKEQEWSRCMHNAGYEYANRGDIQAELMPTAMEINNKIIQIPVENFQVPSALQSEIDDLRSLEQQIAAADLACSTETRYDEFMADFVYQQELAFVEENGDKILLELSR